MGDCCEVTDALAAGKVPRMRLAGRRQIAELHAPRYRVLEVNNLGKPGRQRESSVERTEQELGLGTLG